MATTGSKTRTPEEVASAIAASAIARGLDSAKSGIVRILGRKRTFTRVHVGLTDADLGTAAKECGGYTVTAIHTNSGPQVAAAVGKGVADWLRACHGARFEAAPAKPVLKPGTATLFIAVAYSAG